MLKHGTGAKLSEEPARIGLEGEAQHAPTAAASQKRILMKRLRALLNEKFIREDFEAPCICFSMTIFFEILLPLLAYFLKGPSDPNRCHGFDVVKPINITVLGSFEASCCDKKVDCCNEFAFFCTKYRIQTVLAPPNNGECEFLYDSWPGMQEVFNASDVFRLLKKPGYPICFNNFASQCGPFDDHPMVKVTQWVVFLCTYGSALCGTILFFVAICRFVKLASRKIT